MYITMRQFVDKATVMITVIDAVQYDNWFLHIKNGQSLEISAQP